MTKATAKPHRKGAGRVAFLARADLFRSLVEAGHPQRSIYDDHAADLGISYSQFNRYVGKYLLGKAPDHEHQKGDSPSAAPSAGSAQQPAPGPSSEGSGGQPDPKRSPAINQPDQPKKPAWHDAQGNKRNDLI